MARSTVFSYKGQDVDPVALGQKLDVRAVLTGRLVHQGSRLSIQTELVDTQTGARLWGEDYTSKLEDLHKLEQKIASHITEELRMKIQSGKRKIRKPTEIGVAYQLYLKGRYYWNKRTAENLRRAMDQFQRAADIDPFLARGGGLVYIHWALDGGNFAGPYVAALGYSARMRSGEVFMVFDFGGGTLDVTVMRDRPPGRSPIATTVRPESRRDDVWTFVRGELSAGRQAYVIYPLVEESEKIDLRDATAMADHLSQTVFPEWPVGLLHGRLTPDAKQRVMDAFISGALRLLVATTVVEVGVDVPNATVIVVEHAERFGLSQLHQLRGRVGRDRHQSYCCLVYQAPLSDDARERLKAMTETTDGFDIAERDLLLRGPGDFFGTRQAGAPTFRVIDLVRDRELLETARREATDWLASAAPPPDAIARILDGWHKRFQLIEIG
jgi:hypothetical protein